MQILHMHFQFSHKCREYEALKEGEGKGEREEKKKTKKSTSG